MPAINVLTGLTGFAQRHEVLSISLVFLAVLLVFFGDTLASDGLLNSPSSDLKIVFAGKGELFINSLKDGQLPFWDPHIQGGAPFFSNPEFTMVLYPPNLLLLLGNVTAFNFLFFVHIFLAGIFMYIFLRKKLGILASSFGSFSYMLGGYVISTVYAGHYTQLVSLAYLPLMFYFAGRIIETGKAYYSFLFGLVLAFIFFGSHMQFFALSAIAVSLYFAFYARANKAGAKTVFLFLLALIVFFFAASVQFVPYAEFKSFIGSYGYAAASDLSFTPLEIIKLMVPNIFGSPEHYLFVTYYWESAFYIGSIAFVMIYMLFLRRKVMTPEIKFFSALFLVFTVLSFGKYLPFFRILWEYIPIFSVFRSPVRLIFLAVFSLSVLSAYAFSFFQNSTAGERKKLADFLLRASIFVGALVILGTALKQQLENILLYFYSNVFPDVGFVKRYSFEEILSGRFYPGFGDFTFSAVLTVLVLMTFYIALTRIKFGRRVIFLPVALLILETGVYSTSLLYTENTDAIFQEDAVLKFIASDKEDLFRVYNLKKYGTDNYELYDFFSYKYDLYNAGGDSTLELAAYDDYMAKAMASFENNDTSYMEKLNVKYVISPFYISNNLTLLIDGKAKLYRMNSYRPRAYFLKDGNSVNTIAYGTNTIKISVSASSRDTLVLSETYYPGWSARCNGMPKGISPREIFISIGMEPGECDEIMLEYAPSGFYVYSLVSSFSFLISLILAFLFRTYKL